MNTERRKELLEELRIARDRKFPGKVVFSIKETAELLGVSPKTLYNNKKKWHLTGADTLPDIVRCL